MNWKTITITILVAIAVCFIGCAKGDKTEEVVVESPDAAGEMQIPTLTSELIDDFLKIYPTVFAKMSAKKDELEKYRDENPVVSAQGAKAVEDLKLELASEGIDLGQFNAIYQKILYSTYYLMQNKRAESVSSGSVQAKIEALKLRAESPGVSAEDKAKIMQAVAELETAKDIQPQLPPGLSEAEVALVQTRFEEIRTAIMSQIDKFRTDDGGGVVSPAMIQTREKPKQEPAS